MNGESGLFHIDRTGICEYGTPGGTGLELHMSGDRDSSLCIRMSHDAGSKLLLVMNLPASGAFRWILYDQLMGQSVYVRFRDGHPVFIVNPERPYSAISVR